MQYMIYAVFVYVLSGVPGYELHTDPGYRSEVLAVAQSSSCCLLTTTTTTLTKVGRNNQHIQLDWALCIWQEAVIIYGCRASKGCQKCQKPGVNYEVLAWRWRTHCFRHFISCNKLWGGFYSIWVISCNLVVLSWRGCGMQREGARGCSNITGILNMFH